MKPVALPWRTHGGDFLRGLEPSTSSGMGASNLPDVLRRLGDARQVVWTAEEVDLSLRTGYLELAALTRVFWDMRYLENLPAGFSTTQPWEREYAAFDYGCARFTHEDERAFVDDLIAVSSSTNRFCYWSFRYYFNRFLYFDNIYFLTIKY